MESMQYPNPNRSDMVDYLRQIIRATGDNPMRDGLRDTPERFLTWLHASTVAARCDAGALVPQYAEATTEDMQCFMGVPAQSVNEFTLAPIFGVVHLAYVPNKRIYAYDDWERCVKFAFNRITTQDSGSNLLMQRVDLLAAKGVGLVTEFKVGEVWSTKVQLRGSLKSNQMLRQDFLMLLRRTGHRAL